MVDADLRDNEWRVLKTDHAATKVERRHVYVALEMKLLFAADCKLSLLSVHAPRERRAIIRIVNTAR